MRYIDKNELATNLRFGRPIEQLLSDRSEDGNLVIRFIRIEKKTGEFSVALFEVFDCGTTDFLDIYEFSAVDPDFPYGEAKIFFTAEDAIEYSCGELNASPEKFVGSGMVQIEYRDAYHPDW